MDKVYMKSGHTGEVKYVDAEPAELVKLMVAGWSQCEAPDNAQHHSEAAEAPSHHEEESK